MQFGGQRTDLNLKPLGQPHNILIKLSDDVLPDPGAIMVTGITPQQTISEGINEADFLTIFNEEISIPGTIFIGFNNVRFDDEFMRFLLYRNFYDPYAWQYKDERSRWDLLDVVRMTRALRPEGINWPTDKDGKATNQLGLLTTMNNLTHDNAHDALSDVMASIELAKLIKTKQPKLFDFLLAMRDKKAIAKLVTSGQPFVYTSGKYPGEFAKTTVAVMLSEHPKRPAALVWDLRQDPEPFLNLSVSQLVEAWRWSEDKTKVRLPIKTLQYNRCPAVAPLDVIKGEHQAETRQRLGVTSEQITANLKKLANQSSFVKNVLQALDQLDSEQEQRYGSRRPTVDGQLYDGFIPDHDRPLMERVHQTDPKQFDELQTAFIDKRLKQLLPLYKARNFKAALSPEEHEAWEVYRSHYLMDGGENSRLARYLASIQEYARNPSKRNDFLLEELRLWAESISPEPSFE